ncbi:hypothetical protein [Mycolicibacterium sphagni]|uniref:hypothetical protein n=1 Tax=Mycolicibacterium sphagni TaxID=1786 RepID=UPI0021F37B91|nr:hypothetical protein [Mycolicibacterium sphagni]MCV7174819.1 hypothetical protein [Mycolicibacterium sphagni]
MTFAVVDTRMARGRVEAREPLTGELGYTISPDCVEARWERDQGDPEQPMDGRWMLRSVCVTGLRLKKDGTPGQLEASAWFQRFGTRMQEVWPDWLNAAVQQFTPTESHGATHECQFTGKTETHDICDVCGMCDGGI